MTVAPGTVGSDEDQRRTGARTAGWIAGGLSIALLVVIGWSALAAGALAIGVDTIGRDDSGYLMSEATPWTSPGYAVQSEELLVHDGPMGFTVPHWMLGRFRATGAPTGEDGVFIGIGESGDVRRYLRHVARTTVSDPSADPATSRFVDGGSPSVAPADADFWVASAVGLGPREITWNPRPGSWRLVVMNAAGTTPVQADVAVGAEVPGLRPAGPALALLGVLLLGAAAIGGVRWAHRT